MVQCALSDCFLGQRFWQLNMDTIISVPAERSGEKEKNMKKLVSLFLSLVMVGAVLCGCGGGSNQSDEGNNGLQDGRKASNEIVVAIAQDLEDSLDPHAAAAAGTREVLFNIYEGLVKISPDGDLIPAVAERYDISEDGLVYTFTLREGVKFHNGESVTAEDVIYSMNRCADNSGDSALVSAFSAIQDLKAVDERTVSFRLEQPDLELINFLSAAIIPKDSDPQDGFIPGTGPFKLVSRSPQENIVLERFDEYWGTPAGVSKVTYQIYEDPTALMMALKGGSVDLCAHLTSAQAAQLDSNFTVLEGTMNLVQAVYLNNAKAPFDNQKVRQAMSYAIDRQQIMDIMADGHGTAVGSSIYPKLTKYFLPELVDYYSYDPAKGKELALMLYDQGVDIIYVAAAASSTGVFDAAKETGGMVVGCDVDQNNIVPGQVIGSMILNYGNWVYQAFQERENGGLKFGAFKYGLENDGMDLLLPDPSVYKTDDAIAQAVSEARDKIMSGEIEVPDVPVD